LITYRETALLIDPKFSSMDTRQRVAIVVAHELAHQWFGNLVVCFRFDRGQIIYWLFGLDNGLVDRFMAQ